MGIDRVDQREDEPTVVIVEDEEDLAELYARWVSDRWSVSVAYDGREALGVIDDKTSVVLIDRRIPGLSGERLVDEIRARGYDCRIAMVTAVDPDFDVIDLLFDDYLMKPVEREDLIACVDHLLLRSTYQERVREFFALASKRALLDAEKSERERQESERYATLSAEIESMRAELDDTIVELSEHDRYVDVLRDLFRDR